jgi:hypothetical protein
MSRPIGPIRQTGFVVQNLDAALRHWTETLGIGPFHVAREIRFADFRYRSEAAPSPLLSLAFAQAAGMQIELIQQHDDTPSGYRDFLAGGRTGLQHSAAWFAEPEAYDFARRTLILRGMRIRQESTRPGGRFAYFSAGEGVYPELEISEALVPPHDEFVALVARQSLDWNGDDPVRAIDA